VAPSYWPLFNLVLRTPRLSLRPPTDDDFPQLIQAIDAGIHDPQMMPFSMPWTDTEPGARGQQAAQFWWRQRAEWSSNEWHLVFAVFHDDVVVGAQGLFAKHFPVLKEVQTGSWLTQCAQGQGFGKEMRAAVLQLAFEELGAEIARSAAFIDNMPSLAVSRSIGYRDNGRYREAPRGTPNTMINFELTRDEWLARRGELSRAHVSGLDGCLSMFG
jgi:RimJ/RimL family protein N-acetyltransferase